MTIASHCSVIGTTPNGRNGEALDRPLWRRMSWPSGGLKCSGGTSLPTSPKALQQIPLQCVFGRLSRDNSFGMHDKGLNSMPQPRNNSIRPLEALFVTHTSDNTKRVLSHSYPETNNSRWFDVIDLSGRRLQHRFGKKKSKPTFQKSTVGGRLSVVW